MAGIITIILKEIKDNLRDRRALFFALIYGPLVMPALMIGPLVFNVGKQVSSYDSGRTIHMVGMDSAPNFVNYLRSQNLDAQASRGDFQQQLLDGEIKIVLEVSQSYEEDLLAGQPARVILHYNKKDNESQSLFWQLRGAVDGYSRIIAAQRMTVRGFDQKILESIEIAENDVSKEEFGSGILANIIMFVVIFSAMMGAFYLAVDMVAGERERLSLEPLLSLPLTREQVAFAKFIVVLIFCLTATVLSIICVAVWASFLPDVFFGDSDIPGFLTYIKLLFLCLPISLLSASFLMAVASYAKSVKEAQTQMGLAMLFPMTPFFIVQFMNISSTGITTATPIMGQYLLAKSIMHDVSFGLMQTFPLFATTSLLAALFLGYALYQYRREELLG